MNSFGSEVIENTKRGISNESESSIEERKREEVVKEKKSKKKRKYKQKYITRGRKSQRPTLWEISISVFKMLHGTPSLTRDE